MELYNGWSSSGMAIVGSTNGFGSRLNGAPILMTTCVTTKSGRECADEQVNHQEFENRDRLVSGSRSTCRVRSELSF